MLPITTNNMAMMTGEMIIMAEEKITAEKATMIEETIEANIKVAIGTDLLKKLV
jgi:hypothetical protein